MVREIQVRLIMKRKDLKGDPAVKKNHKLRCIGEKGDVNLNNNYFKSRPIFQYLQGGSRMKRRICLM